MIKEHFRSEDLEVIVSGRTFRGKFADTLAAQAFYALLPLKIRMSELNHNEKYAELNTVLPARPQNMTGGIRTGDVMLYGNNCLVLFYTDFQTSYTYTPLAHLENVDTLAKVLGNGSAEVVFRVAAK